MTAQHFDATSTSPAAPSVVPSPAVADSPSLPSNASPSRPVLSFAESLSQGHLWATLQPLIGLEQDDILPITIAGIVISAYCVLVCWMPTLDGWSWEVTWQEVIYPRAAQGAGVVAEYLLLVFFLWPLRVGGWVGGPTIFLASHAALTGFAAFPLSLLYSSYSRRTLLSSSSLSFTDPFSRLVDYLLPPFLIHLFFAFVTPFLLPYILPVLYTLHFNALLLCFGTSIPHLLLLAAVAIEYLQVEGVGALFHSAAGKEGAGANGLKQKEEMEEMKKEIETLKALLKRE